MRIVYACMDCLSRTVEAGMEQDSFLQEQQTRLTEMLRPYQRELTRRQRLADFVNACIRSVGRDDFFTLYELLQSRTCSEVEAEPGCEEARDIFNGLRADATRKVERSQRTDLDEFYPTVDLRSADLPQRLQEWQDHYNQYRPHGSLQGRTPWEAWQERLAVTPFHDEVEARYDASAERIRHPDYRMDLQLAAQSNGNRLPRLGALPPSPRDLSHSGQNG